MPTTMQHHHVTLSPKGDKVETTRELLVQCAAKVAERRAENGPTSWCTSFDEEKGVFYVEALFAGEEAVKFHQQNIQAIMKAFGPCMAAPPATIIRMVFAHA